jgi:hypothetical protein
MSIAIAFDEFEVQVFTSTDVLPELFVSTATSDCSLQGSLQNRLDALKQLQNESPLHAKAGGAVVAPADRLLLQRLAARSLAWVDESPPANQRVAAQASGAFASVRTRDANYAVGQENLRCSKAFCVSIEKSGVEPRAFDRMLMFDKWVTTSDDIAFAELQWPFCAVPYGSNQLETGSPRHHCRRRTKLVDSQNLHSNIYT